MKFNILIIILLLGCNIIAQDTDYSNFIGNPVNLHHAGQIDEPYLFDYEINSSNLDSIVAKPFISNTAESLLIQEYSSLLAENKDHKLSNFIRYKSKFSFTYQGNLISIIKYQSAKDSIISQTKIAQFYKANGKWSKSSIPEIYNIENVFKILTNDAFWEFYNSENNPNYPEINKLKPLVKDANGILNIDKLAQVIKENQSGLSKYLEE